MENIKRGITFIDGGGTIGSIVRGGTRCAGEGSVDLINELIKRYPILARTLRVECTLHAYGGLSENITLPIQQKFVEVVGEAIENGSKSIVVSHGTDTLEHTAGVLHNQISDKCEKNTAIVVLTAANHDTSHPQTDAWDNLKLAIDTSIKPDQPSGVFVAFHQKVIEGNKVAKEPFNGVSMNYADINSENYQIALGLQRRREELICGQIMQEFRISISNRTVQNALVNKVDLNLKREDYSSSRAVIFQLFHSGTARTEGSNPVNRFIDLLNRHGKLCLAVTENGEPVNLKGYETGVALETAGLHAIPGNMTIKTATALVSAIINKHPNGLSNEQILEEIGKTSKNILWRR